MSIIPHTLSLRLKIKIKRNNKNGEKDINPLENTGTYISPSKWDEFISDPSVINIDTRNIYESEIGTFKKFNFDQYKKFHRVS